MTQYEIENCLQKDIHIEVIGSVNAHNLRRTILRILQTYPFANFKIDSSVYKILSPKQLFLLINKSWKIYYSLYNNLYQKRLPYSYGVKNLTQKPTYYWKINYPTGTSRIEYKEQETNEIYLPLEELEQRFLVIMKQEFRDFVVEYKEAIEYNLQNAHTVSAGTLIFKTFIDENKLAGCFKQLYYDYFNEDGVCTLEGKCDKMTFAAYLFVLVESERLGNDHFSSKAKNDFYTFINKKAFSLDKTDKTFRNRLNKLKDFRHKLLNMQAKEKPDVAIQANSHYKNFHTIMETFHNMPYYLETFKIRD